MVQVGQIVLNPHCIAILLSLSYDNNLVLNISKKFKVIFFCIHCQYNPEEGALSAAVVKKAVAKLTTVDLMKG